MSLKEFPNDFQFWNGRLLMDDNMRLLRPGDARNKESFLQPHDNLFALGDCAVSANAPCPTLGGVARV